MASAKEIPGENRNNPSMVFTKVINTRRLAVNFLLLTTGEFVAKLLTFAGFTYMGRVLGPERYGSLEFVLATMVFFTLPVDFGLGAYGAREVARNRDRAIFLLRDIATLRMLLASVSFTILLLLVAVLPKSVEVKLLLTLYGLGLFAAPALLQWFFQGHDLMHWVAITSITRQGVFTGLIFLFLHAGIPLPYIGVFECASVIAVSALCLSIMQTRLGFTIPRLHLRPALLLMAHFREAMPIGLSELAWAFLWYFATVLLGFIVGGESLGWFGASHRVVIALHTFVWLYFFNLLPSLSRCVSIPKQYLLGLLRRSLVTAAWSSIFVAFVITILSRELISLAYGPRFEGATLSLSVLIWMIPLAMLSGHYRYTLIAYNLQKLEFYCTALAAVVSVGLSFIFIPVFGVVGAAMALLVANIVNFASAYAYVHRYVAVIHFHNQLIRPLLTMTASLVMFMILTRLNAWIAGSMAVLTYLSILMVWERDKLLEVFAQIRY